VLETIFFFLLNNNERQIQRMITKDKFEFGQVLGRGGFGEVRLCVDKASGYQYACKMLSKQKIKDAGQVRNIYCVYKL